MNDFFVINFETSFFFITKYRILPISNNNVSYFYLVYIIIRIFFIHFDKMKKENSVDLFLDLIDMLST